MPDFSRTVKSNGVFTLKSRPVNKEPERSPGPGAYKPKDSPSKKSPSYGFGTSSQR